MKALLVIDMQKGDKKTFDNLYKREQMVQNISKLIDGFGNAGEKVVQIKIWIENPEETTMLKKCPGCGIANTPDAELFDELKDKEYDKIVKKTNYSAFWKTDLDEYLKENSIDEVYLVGIHTGACILFTGVDAFYRGYKTSVVKDAVSSVTDDGGMKLKLNKFEELIGDLITTEELLNSLR